MPFPASLLSILLFARRFIAGLSGIWICLASRLQVDFAAWLPRRSQVFALPCRRCRSAGDQGRPVIRRQYYAGIIWHLPGFRAARAACWPPPGYCWRYRFRRRSICRWLAPPPPLRRRDVGCFRRYCPVMAPGSGLLDLRRRACWLCICCRLLQYVTQVRRGVGRHALLARRFDLPAAFAIIYWPGQCRYVGLGNYAAQAIRLPGYLLPHLLLLARVLHLSAGHRAPSSGLLG